MRETTAIPDLKDLRPVNQQRQSKFRDSRFHMRFCYSLIRQLARIEPPDSQETFEAHDHRGRLFGESQM